MEKTAAPEKHGCMVLEMRFPTYIFCLVQKLIKPMNERKSNNVKNIECTLCCGTEASGIYSAVCCSGGYGG